MASISQKAPISSLLNWFLRQIWDKLLGSNKVGSTGLKVKSLVNIHSLVGGGLSDAKSEVWDPLGQSQTTTKVGWVEQVCWDRARACPAVNFKGWFGTQEKITKLLSQWKSLVQMVGFTHNQFQIPTLNTKIRLNLAILMKIWVCKFDFLRETCSLTFLNYDHWFYDFFGLIITQ